MDDPRERPVPGDEADPDRPAGTPAGPRADPTASGGAPEPPVPPAGPAATGHSAADRHSTAARPPATARPPAAGAHPEARGAPGECSRWAVFKDSPFFPAAVLVVILAAAAGLFAGSYTYVMANPTPHHVPTAVVGASDSPRGKAFVRGMEEALDASLELREYATYAQAKRAVDEQRVFAVLYVHQPVGGRPGGAGDRVELDVSGASGASVAEIFTTAGPRVGARVGVPVTVRDLNPLQRGDPRGLAIFYISLAAVIIGFVGAIQLSVHARALNPAERIGFTAAYALLGGFAIAAVVDWLLDALHLPFVESWLILALTLFASGMVFTMFNTLFGRWAMLPTWGLMVLLGNPSSGGAVSWPLLPSVLGHIGRWLPPGASVNAQHTAVYFGGHQHAFPFLVLAGWAVVASTVFWVWRHRHPGGRAAPAPSDAPAA
ncbi:ABC-2 transporter permease [Streptomyces youssoufiensis]